MSEIAFRRDLKTRHEIEEPLAAIIDVAEQLMAGDQQFLGAVDLKILSDVGVLLKEDAPVEPGILWSLVGPMASYLDGVERFALRELSRMGTTVDG